jgi:hypothetical protein
MAFPETGVLDSFNRADEDPLGNGNWSYPLYTDAASALRIVGQVLSGRLAADCSSYWSAATFGPNCEVYATLGAIYNLVPINLLARVTNPNSGSLEGFALVAIPNTGIRVEDASDGSLIGSVISQTISSGDSYGMSIVGNTLTVYYKVGAGAWASIATRDVTGYAATGAGYLGAYIGPQAGGSLTLDNFGGGTLSSGSASPSPSIAPLDGIAWGAQSPDAGEEAVTWQRWKVSGGNPINVSGDQNWGAAMVATGTPCLGEVIDTGDANSKTFTATRDKYASGSGAVTISIRGSASPFAYDAGSPSWSTYSAPVTQAWRYVQLKMES